MNKKAREYVRQPVRANVAPVLSAQVASVKRRKWADRQQARARALLVRMKPVKRWLAEAPGSAQETDTVRRLLLELQEMAEGRRLVPAVRDRETRAAKEVRLKTATSGRGANAGPGGRSRISL